MKIYEFNLKHDNGTVTLRYQDNTLKEAQKRLMEDEKCPLSAITSWHIVPTQKQIRKTQNLMRGL